MGTIRQRKNGTFELRTTHKSLDKPLYSTHATEAAALAFDKLALANLDAGRSLKSRREVAPARSTQISAALRQYLNGAPVAASDRPLVEWLQENLDGTVEGITYRWADQWVARMKREATLKPSTIRKRVESLARAVDWWNRRQHEADSMPVNPLRMLPRGYAGYSPEETKAAGKVVVDAPRDRRLAPEEQERIEATILGVKRPDRQRAMAVPFAADFLALFRLILGTGLRLREAYTLRARNVRLDLRTVRVVTSKTGAGRDVPMTREVHDILAGLLEGRAPDDLIFPFWDGTERDLQRATARLSRQFASVARYAGCEDLREHDLRHEAVCRWMLMRDEGGHWKFRPEEVQRIVGHSSAEMLARYFSLRGSDLAARLW